jgi:putative colanic acid biosynthesis UDP-glucose lipid carrier transferase
MEDIMLSFVILILVSPVMVLIGLAIKSTSNGPVFFKQKRYGLNGKEIWVWKFRTMHTLDNDETSIKQARKNDPRLTLIGGFLRKTSLDELPQFFNSLTGRMSIVGPRPHAKAHNEQYRKLIPKYMLRHKVKPGITGWAQIHGLRGETDTLDKMERRVQYDLYYIDNWSVWMDLKIILLTIIRGFIDKSAY